MKIKFAGNAINVFTVVSRHTDLQTYMNSLKLLAQQSDRLGFTGMLFFVGNETPTEPWLTAGHIAASTRSLSPFIALNPVYMHPFSAARTIATLSYLYQRRVFINFIAGTSIAGHEALGEAELDHQSRYVRLKEYAICVRDLLASRRPCNFNGHYYQLKNLQLPLSLPEALQPRFYVSGQSEGAQNVADVVDGERFCIISPQLENPLGQGGVYLGMITKASRVDAWHEAQRMFPEDESGQQVVTHTMKYTDAQWKHHLYQQAQESSSASNGYWISPFKNNRSDCPYVVKSHQEMADMVARLIFQGTTSFIVDLPEDVSQLAELSQVFAIAEKKLLAYESDQFSAQIKGDKNG
ncbi:LLM class flavin-dependent oxidoreductase [Xenorhabdus bovienii]|uniref:LLM class flavin-dependent oxidoreductase n=2 Tax=Xenorhabdus bovienii TaxID=40576 RepID=A0AAJ1MXC6_XENBV|nr:LLM class flavin-dependent oxidoreductase [Xenorhabdus bovienii]MDE1476888.1 LLM class flavin-dependent oxidoreductase [Xenorhabdus bovienii]MDE1485097.1 LLM class flavin-dependent oxidoreductase [Xenorhabdus bovienii]MDE1494192.1 LLM class flavin-dependent oxidoreductase [Xenorhabdus bovienii]MDE9430275.1 LLM class flavin-dependent oxidoreductase [Xenorhabdus bovienii]MDE9444922.1 LLM class flavin-dependent oxidoreductase [Xenorhabdus bovienii]